MTEQRQLIEILAQAKEERDKALEKAKRALNYEPVEPSNDTPFLTTMDLMAMSIGVEKSEQSQSFNGIPLFPSQAQTLHTEPDNSSHLDQLLDEYTRLQKNLIDEIHSEQYVIQPDSRKRLKLWVDNAHNNEVRRLKVTYPYYWDANGEFKEWGKRQVQPSSVSGLAEKNAENLLQVETSDDFESKPTDRTSNLSSQPSETTAIMPRTPASEPELEAYKYEPLPLQPEPEYEPEYLAKIWGQWGQQPSQLIKKPVQPGDNQAEVSSTRKKLRKYCDVCHQANKVSLLFPVIIKYLLCCRLTFYRLYTHRRLALLWRMTDIVKHI